MAEKQEKDRKPITLIDKHNLDEEWVGQPKKVEKYALALAEAQFDLNELDAELDVVKAELGFAIRQNPGNYKLTKVTDESVKSTILLQTRHKEALAAVNEAQRVVDYYKGILNALENRKKALENLCYLHGQSYFGPREITAPKGGGVDRSKMVKKGP